ncbi:MAG: hypothetical protein U1E46_05910 [Hyphomicrobiales bacterium]
MSSHTIELSRYSYEPAEPVKEALADMGRTEDIEFSPDQTRLVIAGFRKHSLLFVDFKRDTSSDRITSSNCIEVVSEHIRLPHGVAWLDNDTVIVASRGGKVAVFDVPAFQPGRARVTVEPIRVLQSSDAKTLKTPGSVCVNWIDADQVDVLVCNNYVHTVSRHRLVRSRRWEQAEEQRVFGSGLDVPDSVTAARGGTYFAVSNHNKHRVDLFASYSNNPVSKIAGCGYPHGVRFVRNCEFVIVADAGAPMIHIYRSPTGAWRGWKSPVVSARVVPDETFFRFEGRGEGGPKGLDFTQDAGVMATTCEGQAVAFFRIGPLLDQLATEGASSSRYRPNLYERTLNLAPASLLQNGSLRRFAGRVLYARHVARMAAGRSRS